MSFVEFNLLPDVKIEYIKTQHAKRLVYAISAIAVAISLAILTISFLSVNVVQKKLLSDANGKIISDSQKLKSITDLDKILTIQNQLNSLPPLHDQKHYTSRLLTYLPALTPANAHIGKLNLDTTANTLTITGTADNIETVNKYVDTVKFTVYTIPGVSNEKDCGKAGGKWDKNKKICTKAAFSNVVLTKADRTDKIASYTIDAEYDPSLFTGANGVDLIVSNEVTTQSVVNTPSTNGELFNGQTNTKNSQEEGQ
jgi:type II secretory pathway component GspD/PulD (secretin)